MQTLHFALGLRMAHGTDVEPNALLLKFVVSAASVRIHWRDSTTGCRGPWWLASGSPTSSKAVRRQPSTPLGPRRGQAKQPAPDAEGGGRLPAPAPSMGGCHAHGPRHREKITANGYGLTRVRRGSDEAGHSALHRYVRHPQTQGKVERLHHTLEDPCTRHGPADLSGLAEFWRDFRAPNCRFYSHMKRSPLGRFPLQPVRTLNPSPPQPGITAPPLWWPAVYAIVLHPRTPTSTPYLGSGLRPPQRPWRWWAAAVGALKDALCERDWFSPGAASTATTSC